MTKRSLYEALNHSQTGADLLNLTKTVDEIECWMRRKATGMGLQKFGSVCAYKQPGTHLGGLWGKSGAPEGPIDGQHHSRYAEHAIKIDDGVSK